MIINQNTSPGECAVRMARAGAKIIGVNCLFDPFQCIETLTAMKAGLDEAGEDTMSSLIQNVLMTITMFRSECPHDGPAPGLQDT